MAENLLIKNAIQSYNEKNYNAALKYLKKYMDSNKSNVDYRVYYYLGLIYTQLGDLNNAIENFRKLIPIKLPLKMAIQFRMILGYIYSLKENFSLAKDIFNSVLKIQPDNVQAMASLGYVYYKMNKNKEAIKILKKALKIDKNNPNIHNSLGYIYATMNKTDIAIKECKKALELKPDYPAYLDSMGWAYFKAGRLADAKKYLALALDKLPENKEVKEHFKELVIKDMIRKDKLD